MKKKIAIITPGGDASGINAAIRAITRIAISSGFDVYGIMNGFKGLLEEKIFQMNLRTVSGIVQRGGTILKSSRCAEIKTTQGMEKAIKILKKHKIDFLVVIGGDGSITASEKISKEVPCVCIPASIDNDIYGTDETIGFDSAIDTAIEAIDRIRDTAISFDRIFVIEVMGREHGFLAIEIALASGAEFVLIPELHKRDSQEVINKICKELKSYKEKGKTSAIIIFAEGCGNANEFAKKIGESTGFDVRVSNLGYIQRGGNPTARSRNLACKFGSYAVDLIKKEKYNSVVVLQNNKIKSLPIKEVVSKEKTIDRNILTLIEELAV